MAPQSPGSQLVACPKDKNSHENALSLPRSWEFLPLDVVDVDLLAAGTALVAAVRVAVLVELEAAVAVLATAEVVRLVDLGGLGELSVCLERAGLVGCVLETTRCVDTGQLLGT